MFPKFLRLRFPAEKTKEEFKHPMVVNLSVHLWPPRERYPFSKAGHQVESASARENKSSRSNKDFSETSKPHSSYKITEIDDELNERVKL